MLTEIQATNLIKETMRKMVPGDQTSLKTVHLKGLIYVLKIKHLQTSFSLITEKPSFKSIFPNKREEQIMNILAGRILIKWDKQTEISLLLWIIRNDQKWKDHVVRSNLTLLLSSLI